MNKRKRAGLLVALVVLGVFAFSLPSELFDDPTSTVLEDEHGTLLGAKIAADGQWRFPQIDSVPANLEAAILEYEDAYFHWHFGVNPISLVRALLQNWQQDRIVSGGSTISMQVVRLSRKNQPRTYGEKLLELWLAIRLECSYSKDEILALYASHAPYGGNVVGLEAASWRYFHRPVDQLSWSESATLAVLPNAPSLLHLGRNRPALEQKRNRLLAKLWRSEVIDSTTCALAQQEPLPANPQTLPNDASHLLSYAVKQGLEGQRVKTTIHRELQHTLSDRLDRYVKLLAENEVHNACAMVVNLRSGRVEAYVGNARSKTTRAPYVDLIHAPRSSGSILKPFLYGKAFESGQIQPSTLLRDVPISIGKFSPQNFDKRFDGYVPAGQALSRSLNVPAALLLKAHGVTAFYHDLENLGLTSLTRSAETYGLSLILGGAEVRLWNLAELYAGNAQGLSSATGANLHHKPMHVFDQTDLLKPQGTAMQPGAWWLISEALTETERPGLQQHWRRFSSSRRIAWKTGTSHGFRDAWAIGYDAEYLVAVWVGNADGEGRPGLTGTSTAAPLMFEAFNLLRVEGWFDKPEAHLKTVELCAESGAAPNQFCPRREVEIPVDARLPALCKAHSLVFLNAEGKRVFRECAGSDFTDTVWFSFDPVAAYYYVQRHPSYRPLPPFSDDCGKEEQEVLAVIYPANGTEIIIPRDFSGQQEAIQLVATHQDARAKLYWHLDDAFLGETQSPHQMTRALEPGTHRLTVIDEKGNKASIVFKVYGA